MQQKTSGKLSQADEVEAQAATTGKSHGKVGSIWDSFEITKIDNVGFKLEYVNPINIGDQLIRAIDAEDISSKVKFWHNYVVYYIV